MPKELTGMVTEKEVDLAEYSLEVDKTEELIRSLAIQQRLALLSCYKVILGGARKASTGQVYGVYLDICKKEMIRPLTQRRFSDMISFLDLYGLVNARVVSKGRYGNTREISGVLPEEVVARLLGKIPVARQVKLGQSR